MPTFKMEQSQNTKKVYRDHRGLVVEMRRPDERIVGVSYFESHMRKMRRETILVFFLNFLIMIIILISHSSHSFPYLLSFLFFSITSRLHFSSEKFLYFCFLWLFCLFLVWFGSLLFFKTRILSVPLVVLEPTL